MRAILVMCAIGVAAAGLAAARPDLQVPGAVRADPVTAILAAHKTADDAYAKAVMSPFTAVAVQYFQPGQTVRLGLGSSGAAFGAAPAAPDVIELSLDDGAFWITRCRAPAPRWSRPPGTGTSRDCRVRP